MSAKVVAYFVIMVEAAIRRSAVPMPIGRSFVRFCGSLCNATTY